MGVDNAVVNNGVTVCPIFMSFFVMSIHFKVFGLTYKEDLIKRFVNVMAGGVEGILVIPNAYSPFDKKKEKI